MFFAAFEKKWWRMGDSDNKSEKNPADNFKDTIEEFEYKNVQSVNEIEELEDAALHTAQADWIEGEEKIEHINESRVESFPEDEEDEEEVFTNDDNFEQVDPHAPPAFELDDFEEDAPSQRRDKPKLRISTVKEFFNTEILYRYDILEDFDRDAIKGDYRIELTGDQSGTWSIALGKNIEILNEYKDAPVTLKMDSEDFLSIVNGKINSQIALVSRRVRIEGDTKKASLLQNILAPRTE